MTRSDENRRPLLASPAGTTHRRALVAYTASAIVALGGAWLAARPFPGGFDWRYTVVSDLASPKHNPDGAGWFSAGLALAMVLALFSTTGISGADPGLQPAARSGRLRDRGTTFFLRALRYGMVGGILVGIESLVGIDLSDWIRKGHEILAILTFVLLYAGVLGLQLCARRRRSTTRWLLLGTFFPILGTGVATLLVYLDPRPLGWVDQGWRNLGIPIWMSLAFWEWLAVVALWSGLGWMVFRPAVAPPQDAQDAGGDAGDAGGLAPNRTP